MQNITKKEVTIPNWTIFGAHSVSIELHKFINENDQDEYNSCLTIYLNDGEEDQEKVITIVTDIWNSCAHCCALTSVHHICQIFDDIADVVLVIDERGEIVDEFSLTEISSEQQEESFTPPIVSTVFH
jgi:hypothetical protein